MADKLVTIATYSTPEEAHVAKNALEAAGIPTFFADEATVGLEWILNNALGGIKLQVPDDHCEAAEQVLAGQEPATAPATDEADAQPPGEEGTPEGDALTYE